MWQKIKIARIIITKILIMALGVTCCIMPMPWRLIVPIIIGTRSILIESWLQFKRTQLTNQITEQGKEPKRGKKENGKKKQSGGKVKKENKAADKSDSKKAA